MTNHTPTPWDHTPTAGNHQHLIWDKHGKTIAVVYTDKDDAELIVRAVNSHNMLVRAIETLQGQFNRLHSQGQIADDELHHALTISSQVLKLASVS